MADTKPNKPEEAAKNPASAPAGTETSVSEEQKSSGPIGDAAVKEVIEKSEDPKKTATYYLRDGKVHETIVKGERRTLIRAGEPVELTPAQFKAFRDKVWTKEEHAAWRAGNGLAEGANSAEMEQATINERQAQLAAAAGDVNKDVDKADEKADKADEK